MPAAAARWRRVQAGSGAFHSVFPTKRRSRNPSQASPVRMTSAPASRSDGGTASSGEVVSVPDCAAIVVRKVGKSTSDFHLSAGQMQSLFRRDDDADCMNGLGANAV